MAKAPIEIKSLARTHTQSALKTLASIMNEPSAPAAARVAAAQALIDRGWGKATQFVDATIRKTTAKQLSDDELADIATGSSEGIADEAINPSQLN